MAAINKHEVKYYIWCKKCKYRDLPEQKDPCHWCLTQPYNYNSYQPINFEPAKETK